MKHEEISSPISAHIFEFCDSELFQEALQNSEVTSSSTCCYEDSYPNPIHGNGGGTTAGPATTSTAATATSNLSIIFDSPEEIENDISASIDFSTSPPFSAPPHYLDFSSVEPQIPPTGVPPPLPLYPPEQPPHVIPLLPVFEDDCLSSLPPYLRLNPSSSFLESSFLNQALSSESAGMFSALGPEMAQPQELEYQGDSAGIFCTDAMQRVLNPGELQGLGGEGQQMVSGGGGCSAALASEISSLEDSAYKVGKLSVEQRKEKIHRYLKKRNERNFSKKIKYACRKTLADSRPRVRGRFAKNDEFGENPRGSSSNHEDEDDDDDVLVKEEDDMVDSTDIFAQISGVNSFNCNYPIQSWI